MDKSFLDVGGPYISESPIREMFMHSFLPFSSSTLNNGDEIRIAIQNRDAHTLPSESFIYIEGKIIKPDEMKTTINIAHNGLTNLFSEMKYEINSTEVQRVKKPGITILHFQREHTGRRTSLRASPTNY